MPQPRVVDVATVTTTAELPRRAWLGARLAGDAAAFTPAGLRLAGVVSGGMAAAAGLGAGDVVEALAGAPVRTLAELRAALRAAGAAAEATLTWRRDGVVRTARVAVTPHPREASAGVDVTYGALDVPGARLRTVTTAPAAAPARAIALLVQGIACETVDPGAADGGPLAALAHAWARAGVIAVRVDRRGVGDSTGGPCGDVDLATDLADARAAWATLPAALPRIVLGHSVGGMLAPLVADDAAGVIVTGTSMARWLDCVAAGQARQWRACGASPEDAARRADEVRARSLADGASGRSPRFHAQLDALDLPAAWARVRAPVLVARGEHDEVVGADEQAALASHVGGELVDLPGLDHLLGAHASAAAARADYGHGRGSDALAAATLEWIARVVVRSAR